MDWTHYVFALFVFALLIICIFFFDRLRRARRETDEELKEKEQRLFQLFYTLEDTIDDMEAFVRDSKEEIRREKANMEDISLRVERIYTTINTTLAEIAQQRARSDGRTAPARNHSTASNQTELHAPSAPRRQNQPTPAASRTSQRPTAATAAPMEPDTGVVNNIRMPAQAAASKPIPAASPQPEPLPAAVEQPAADAPFEPLDIPVTRSVPPPQAGLDMARGAYRTASKPTLEANGLADDRVASMPSPATSVDSVSISQVGQSVGQSAAARLAAESAVESAPAPDAPQKRRGRPPKNASQPKAVAATRELTKTERVQQLHQEGFDTDYISQELSLSRGEVDLILGMGRR
ncbi:hypothetical protein LJC20_02035 [Eubacteriales bacterium OttesenSCG-928-M02]|nr:hypothetical protein [Eubacteriales bacterium OttesenSCG-928-M02]